MTERIDGWVARTGAVDGDRGKSDTFTADIFGVVEVRPTVRGSFDISLFTAGTVSTQHDARLHHSTRLPRVLQVDERSRVCCQPGGHPLGFGALSRHNRASIGPVLVANDNRLEIGFIARILRGRGQSLSGGLIVVTAG
uniref:Uncharacterized protein n=1 Tax=Natrinema halophilum TaxID=1699371 RepID=A0A7D5GMK5_9EURY